ncbi:MAG TPA: hypothetical protein VGM90_32690 [Kofleriaceae bacterium]
MDESPRPKTPRFWAVVQPSIVKVYKAAGLVALTAILIGLIGFLVVNVFYFFDHTWVRPIVLSPTHQKVVEASTQLADAKLRLSQIDTEKIEIDAKLAEIDRTVASDDALLKSLDGVTPPEKPTTNEQVQLLRTIDQVKLERDNAIGQKAPLAQRTESLKLRKADQDAIVKRLEQAPYLRAVNNKIVLAFVPYQNLRNVKLGTKLYGCAWGLVACHSVGKVTAVLDGEVTEMHPHDESIQRGVMVEIDVSSSAAGESVLFAGSKPLFLF